MTRIDFYILPQQEVQERLFYACRLTEKAWRQGHDIYIHVPNLEAARKVDSFLWDAPLAESFLPHSILGEGSGRQERIAIGFDDDPGSHHDLMINLAVDIPEFFSRFERVAEIVCQHTPILEASRKNWQFYQQRGYPLKSHNIQQGQESNNV